MRKIYQIDHTATQLIHRRNGTSMVVPLSDLLVVTARIAGWDIDRVYVDTGANANVIYKHTLVNRGFGRN